MSKILQLLLPGIFRTIWFALKHKAQVSPRSEVDVSAQAQLGAGTVVSAYTKIKVNGALSVGENCSIGTGVFIAVEDGGIEIGNHCMIGSNASIIGNNYKYALGDTPIMYQEKTSVGIKIGNDVWIGAGAIVLDGAKIEDGCIVTPGSVVSGTVASNSIVQGNPAKTLFMRRR